MAKRAASKKKSDLDRTRLRFNWGYHDGASQHMRGDSPVRPDGLTRFTIAERHFDPAYGAGYVSGWDDAKAARYAGDSSEAWEREKGTPPLDREFAPYRVSRNSGRRGRAVGRPRRSRRTRAVGLRNPRRALSPAAISRFKSFHGSAPRQASSITLPDLRELVHLGDAVSVIYRSDKWDGRPKLYEHKFAPGGPSIATDPSGKVLVVLGGRLKVTDRGITG